VLAVPLEPSGELATVKPKLLGGGISPKPKLLGGGISPKALTWAFASSMASLLATWLTSANVIMVSGNGRGFSVQKNLALISVLAGQDRNIYAELQ